MHENGMDKRAWKDSGMPAEQGNNPGGGRSMKTRYIAFMGLLVGIAMSLHAVEALIPVPFFIPGAKLGLANIVTLYVLSIRGLREALAVTALRCLLGSLISGTFLNFAFFLSTSGGIMSTLIMGLTMIMLKTRTSLIGVSVTGAVVHNITQLLVAVLITSQWGLLVYLPYLLLFAVPTGLFMGMLAGDIVQRTRRQSENFDRR